MEWNVSTTRSSSKFTDGFSINNILMNSFANNNAVTLNQYHLLIRPLSGLGGVQILSEHETVATISVTTL